MGLVMRFDLYLMFVMLMGLGFTISNGYKFYVGGKDGWVPTPSEDYSHWSHRNRFQVNDTLPTQVPTFSLVATLKTVLKELSSPGPSPGVEPSSDSNSRVPAPGPATAPNSAGLGISTSRQLQASEEPVSSPLSSPALLGSGKEEEQKIIPKRQKVQAVLKSIKQSPKKVNLVAALVRGMRVEDALIQLQVTVKRAAQTVYRHTTCFVNTMLKGVKYIILQVIHAARANATHNHGLDPDRLLVVIVRETTPEEEAEIARLKVHNFKKKSKRERQLVPHKLIETSPIWNRRGTKANHRSSELVLTIILDVTCVGNMEKNRLDNLTNQNNIYHHNPEGP
ncbi:copper-binding protein-like [Arabidopsis thaliana]|nr:copper-binding protein-like [Arabidopsis thaliana]CAB79638.1 copper-binding protein-like [Arabidopsis thaliana]